MFKTIVAKIDRDKDFPDRAFTLDVLSRVREGALYDHLTHAFATERTGSGEYVPLKDRRPSVRHNICRTVVDDTVGLLFAEGHFPAIESEDENAPERIGRLVKASKLNDVMVEAATIGSIGSVAVQMRVLQAPDKTFRLFFDAHETTFLTPVYKDYAPDVLDRIIERYKVRGKSLRDKGYAIGDDDLNAWFWFRREWDEAAELWFQPVKVNPVTPEEVALAENPPQDDERSVTHNLGFVPWVWIKNLPGKLRLVDPDYNAAPLYSDLDGACTFFGAVDAMIEIDYLLSQGGRGLKYSADPLLVIKEPPAPSEELVKSPDSALVLDKEGDAKMLEINGASFAVVLEWVRALREFGLENVHGNRADPQKMHGVQSGRAMEMMNQALIWLADKLRISYGENGYRRLIQMAIQAHKAFPLTIDGAVLEPIDPLLTFTLNWPPFFLKTADDLFNEAQAMKTLRDAGLISRNTAIANIASNYDIEDVAAEEKAILADKQGEMDMVVEQANRTRPAPPSE